MALSFFTPNRTVLLVSDDVLSIYTTNARGVKLIEAVPWDADGFEQSVANIITKECGNNPILILNDMVEQHYRKERVIKTGVGIMDRPAMLKRKLNLAFPNYPVRAPLLLKEKVDKKEGKLAADIYIFCAVPDTVQLQNTLGAVNITVSSISAFCLLPIESSDMVSKLSAKLMPKGQKAPKWTLFIGQHKNGGLRQIVTKNGELALTRMTPVLEDDSDAELWVDSVTQEFHATMSYLSRFGFQPEDGLDVIMLSSPETGEVFGRRLDGNFSFRHMTVFEAARVLGVSLGKQDNVRFADMLHVAWAGRKSKFILPMKAQQIDKVTKPRQMAAAASLALFLGASFLAYQLVDNIQTLTITNSDLDDAQSRLNHLQVELASEVKRKEEANIDILLVQGSLASYNALQKQDVEPLRLFLGVGRGLGADMRVDRINVDAPAPNADAEVDVESLNAGNNQSGPQKQDASLYNVSMQMTYPASTNIDNGNREVADLRDRLSRILPGHEVTVTKFLKDYDYAEGIVVDAGDVQRRNIEQDYIAELGISGPDLVSRVQERNPQGGTND